MGTISTGLAVVMLHQDRLSLDSEVNLHEPSESAPRNRDGKTWKRIAAATCCCCCLIAIVIAVAVVVTADRTQIRLDVDRMMETLSEFERIAKDHNGSRSITKGF